MFQIRDEHKEQCRKESLSNPFLQWALFALASATLLFLFYLFSILFLVFISLRGEEPQTVLIRGINHTLLFIMGPQEMFPLMIRPELLPTDLGSKPKL